MGDPLSLGAFMGSLGRVEDDYVKLRQQVDDAIRELAAAEGAERDRLVRDIEANFQEAAETMEMMEMEAADTETNERLRMYKESAKEAKERYMMAMAGVEHRELFDGGGATETQSKTFEAQRAKLQRGQDKLDAARAEMQDTLAVAHGTMESLHSQRQTIENIGKNTDRATESVGRSEATLKRIKNNWKNLWGWGGAM